MEQTVIETKQNTYKNFARRLPILSLNITIMASLLLIFVFLGATSYLYLQSSSTNTYRQALEEAFRPENAEQEWKRLFKHDGNPTVVAYEEGRTPFFYDKQSGKFALIYPLKEIGSVNHPTKDSADDVHSMLDQESFRK
jgi:hypothetical protein